MKIKALELTAKDATDIVIGAIEGRDIPRFEVLVRIKEDADQVDPERSPNDWFEITTANLEVGTALALERYPHLFNGFSGENGDVEMDLDATGCDVIFQMTVFGTVVYG